MSHVHARPAVFFWSLVSVFFVALLWVGLVPKVRAAAAPEPANVIRLRVAGDWRPTMEKARDSALEEAQSSLAAKLRELDPSFSRMPDVDDVASMVVSETPAEGWFGPPIGEMYTMITLELEVRPEHFRALRREEHIVNAAWLMGVASLLLAVVALFFRVEEWTKGYLTRWLVLGAIGASGLILGLWWLIKS